MTVVLNDPGDRALEFIDDPETHLVLTFTPTLRQQGPRNDRLARAISDTVARVSPCALEPTVSTAPAFLVLSTMTTFQRDEDQDIELETTKKLDAQHDEFIDADADADSVAAKAQQDYNDKDFNSNAGM